MFSKGFWKSRSRSRSRTRDTDKDNATEASSNRERRQSNASTFAGSLVRRFTTSPSPNTEDNDPFGLTLVSDCPNPEADIIFVHGLGGGSVKTWCHNRNRNYFWPSEFLPLDLPNVRVMTFGYDANFVSSKATTYNVTDFAKQLIFAMLYSPCEIGKHPVIFVVHSMGGLVTKKAYMLALQDSSYQKIAKSIYGIVFLGTPHRGADNAQTLQNLVQVVLARPPKAYLNDLTRNSAALQAINEDFRHVSERLKVVSFYEMRKTSIGPKSLMIVEKDSATLGYKTEYSVPLNADHHTICKPVSREDDNYIAIASCLQKLITDYGKEEGGLTGSIAQLTLDGLDEEEELRSFRDMRLQGSCQWVIRLENFRRWTADEDKSSILWLYGPPGSGKSMISSFVIDHIRSTNNSSQFFFCTDAEQHKFQSTFLLRSLAGQMAKKFASVHRELSDLRELDRLEFMDARALWQKLFVGVILKTDFQRPLYWVLDALDECDNPALMIRLLGTMQSKSPIKVFFTSRYSDNIATAVSQAKVTVFRNQISPDDTLTDIVSYIASSIQNIALPGKNQGSTVELLQGKAGGSFLWVRLAVENIQDFGQTQAGLNAALEAVPSEMEGLYHRVLTGFTKMHAEKLKLVKSILKWAIFPTRPLFIDELHYALERELGPVTELENVINTTCGNFVCLDGRKRLKPIHQTARAFLLENDVKGFEFNQKAVHAEIASLCLEFIAGGNLRLPIGQPDKRDERIASILQQPFTLYAIEAWSEHLKRSESATSNIVVKLSTFFRTNVLVWVALLASKDRLATAVQSAKNMQKFLSRSEFDTGGNDLSSRGGVDLQFLRNWSVDLIRVATKYGQYLVAAPSSIFEVIPQLCPRSSAIFQQSKNSRTAFKVQGYNSETWNDCIARMRLHGEGTVATIVNNGEYIALGYDTGEVEVFDAYTCQEHSRFECKSGVRSLQFNSFGSKLVTGGVKSVQVWDVSSSKEVASMQLSEQILSVAFDSKDEIIIITRDCAFAKWNWQSKDSGMTEHFKWNEESSGGLNRGFPVAVALSASNRHLAVSYRGHPVSIWDTELKFRIGEVSRNPDNNPHFIEDTAISMDFNRVTGNLWLAYSDGTILKWDALTYERKECLADASCVVCSPDGMTAATGDSFGNIKIWDTESLELIQRISTEDEPIEALCFSADSTRFFDVRGTYCSAWEPECLIRTVDLSHTQSETNPHQKTITISPFAETPAITTLVVDKTGTFAFYGRDDGAVFLKSLESGSNTAKVVVQHAKGSSIVALTTSVQEKFMATADDTRTVLVHEISEASDQEKVTFTKIANAKAKDPIRQLLFDEAEKLLLIITSTGCECLALKTFTHAIFDHTPSSDSYWILQPSSNKVLAVTQDRINRYNWDEDGLKEPASRPCLRAIEKFTQKASRPVITRVVTHVSKRRGACFILESSPQSATSARGEITIYEWTDELSNSLTEYMVFGRVEHLIGVYGNLIVFLDKDFWVCSWDIWEKSSNHTKHCFIPADWINGVNRPLYEVTAKGDVVVATHGDLIVIKSGLRVSF